MSMSGKRIFLLAGAVLLVAAVAQAQMVAAPKIIAAQLYADWCTSCKILDPAYQEVKEQFANKDVLFVRFDRTNEQTTHSSEMLASAIGFQKGYQAFEGTGKILLIDAGSKKVVGKLTKEHSASDMAMALQGALAGEVMMDKGSAKGSEKGSMMDKGSVKGGEKGSMMDKGSMKGSGY